MNIRKLHYFSGLTITVFIMLHLFNHATSIMGAATHIEIMKQLRLLYRNSLSETILLIAVCVQIFSGLKLAFRKRKKPATFFGRVQVWSGLYLALFLVIHLTAVMMGRYVLHLDTNYYFGVAGLNTFPYSMFFIPYYSLATLAVFAHLAAVHYHKMKKAIWGMPPDVQAKLLILAGGILALFLIYGLTNRFAGVQIPEAYKILVGG